MEEKTDIPEEILDLVDEEDKVVGEVIKRDAYRNPKLLHREAGILLYSFDKKILFQRRSLKKSVAPGEWQITAAGHVTKGLTPLEAAHKELKEEVGFDAQLKFVEKVLVRRPHETHFTYRYIGKYEGQKIIVEKDEVEEAQLLNEVELDDLLATGVPYNNESYKMAKRFWRGEFNHLL